MRFSVRKTMRIAASAALAVVLVGTMAACSSSGGGGGSNEKAELEFWTFLDPSVQGDPRAVAMQELVDQYNAESEVANVTIVAYNFGKIDAEVIRAAASGGGPDIMDVQTIQIPLHGDAKSLLPLNEYAEPWLEEAGGDYPFNDEMRYNGDILSLQWEQRGFFLWYRQDLLEEVGLEVPTTLDEMRDVAAALKAATGKTGMAIPFSPEGLGAGFMEKYVPFTWGFDGEFMEDGELVLNSPGGVEAMDYMRSLREAGAFGDEVLNMDTITFLDAVKAGTVAMAIEGNHRVASARSAEGIGDNLQTVPLPGRTADEPLSTPVGGWSLAIGANSENPDAAWDFIKFYLSPESQARLTIGGSLPLRASAFDDPEVKALPNIDELLGWREYLADYGRPFPNHPQYGEMGSVLTLAAQEAVFNGESSQKALDDAAAEFGSK